MPARVRDGDGEARDGALTERLERALQPGRSDGILLLSVPLPDRFANQLLDSRQSVVLVDIKHPKFESFTVDNRYGGRAATQHLITLGYERIGHITVQYDPPPARQRREGYEAALREAGRSVDETLIATSNERPFAFSETGGYSAMKQLLEREPGPDAVFAASDMQALGAIRAVRQAGLRVPEDVAIVGFDDVELSLSAGLTTVRQPAQEMGRRAAETLLRRLKDGGGDVESGAPSAARNGSTRLPVSSTVFSPELIVRSSCGAQEE